MDQVRQAIIDRGSGSIKALQRSFRNFDDDGNWNLNKEEFMEGLKDYGVKISDADADQVFKQFAKDNDTINWSEFLIAVKPPKLSDIRTAIVLKAFKKADKTGDGVISSADLKRVYNAGEHPKFQNGEKTEDQVFEEFLNSFETTENTRDGKVTKEEFVEYYRCLGANIDNDEHFDLTVRNAWKL